MTRSVDDLVLESEEAWLLAGDVRAQLVNGCPSCGSVWLLHHCHADPPMAP